MASQQCPKNPKIPKNEVFGWNFSFKHFQQYLEVARSVKKAVDCRLLILPVFLRKRY